MNTARWSKLRYAKEYNFMGGEVELAHYDTHLKENVIDYTTTWYEMIIK